jgi:hypothetical protein
VLAITIALPLVEIGAGFGMYMPVLFFQCPSGLTLIVKIIYFDLSKLKAVYNRKGQDNGNTAEF